MFGGLRRNPRMRVESLQGELQQKKEKGDLLLEEPCGGPDEGGGGSGQNKKEAKNPVRPEAPASSPLYYGQKKGECPWEKRSCLSAPMWGGVQIIDALFALSIP